MGFKFNTRRSLGLPIGGGGGAILKPQDVFATSLYTHTGAANNFHATTFDPDFTWEKSRNAVGTHYLFDKIRGAGKVLSTDQTIAEQAFPAGYSENRTGGFYDSGYANGTTAVGYSFKFAPKFAVEVTWTGDGTSNRQIPHGLGVVPGMVIGKARSVANQNWQVTHRSLSSATARLLLNDTAPEQPANALFYPSAATDTTISVGQSLNAAGQTYVAYLFAHDPSADGIVQCGGAAIASDGSVSIPLPWLTQWIMFKRTDTTGQWYIIDASRGFSPTAKFLYANLSNAEVDLGFAVPVSPSGVTVPAGQLYGSAGSLIFAAIRAPY
ncbi:hypothetical protein [Methylobacterium sp. Leaf87]|uniref:DUF7483 domain-containing protein n=1 Tax=Methylobacterium sp. Leaf87 TaxID=1736243 RepID=UPI000AB73D88|nr:hypothetical protein [Methylobacterium sp. Leaf87]